MTDGFGHERLRVYQAGVEFVAWGEEICEQCARKIRALDHLRRASGGIPVNIAEGNGRRSARERSHYLEIACGSALECAACLDVMSVRRCLREADQRAGKEQLAGIVAMLLGLRKAAPRLVQEEQASYGSPSAARQRKWFDHERLDVYRQALEFVAWCERHEETGTDGLLRLSALDEASTGIVLNIAEGNGRFSIKDRCRFIEHARSSALRAASSLDVLAARNASQHVAAAEGKAELVRTVSLLTGWERSLRQRSCSLSYS
jgi:four helix bundle protein